MKYSFSNMDTMLFDLDNALYTKSSGLLPAIGERIRLFGTQHCGMSLQDAEDTRLKFLDIYGSSLAGYVRATNVTPEEYTAFVYDLDYKRYISKDEELIRLLDKYKHNKIVYTNGAHTHAQAVLSILGITDFFSQIIAIEDLLFIAKPLPESYKKMLSLTGIDATKTVFFDDSLRNLITAKEFGMTTTLIAYDDYPNINTEQGKAPDIIITTLNELNA